MSVPSWTRNLHQTESNKLANQHWLKKLLNKDNMTSGQTENKKWIFQETYVCIDHRMSQIFTYLFLSLVFVILIQDAY